MFISNDSRVKILEVESGGAIRNRIIDGGIKILQPNSSTSLDLTIGLILAPLQLLQMRMYLSILRVQMLQNLNITSANDSFVVLENSRRVNL
ncbi:MAG: hypothetical protein CM15mP14_3520 [Rhodospirillaceae bacterium]|nr:MAG: hypothetical protein CM15mP14_3520 [Rhodospirillaceae bacterium]